MYFSYESAKKYMYGGTRCIVHMAIFDEDKNFETDLRLMKLVLLLFLFARCPIHYSLTSFDGHQG